MRNFFALIGFVVVVFAVVGYFRNWYTINWNTTSDGKVQVNTNIDTKKIKEDSREAGQQVGEKMQNLREELKNPTPEKDANGNLLPKPPISFPGPISK